MSREAFGRREGLGDVIGAYRWLKANEPIPGAWFAWKAHRALPMGTSEHPHGDVDRMPLRKAHSVCLQVFQELSVYLFSRAWMELVAVRHA